ncbi:MAG: hypothetical protein JO350_12200, partial [Candidatus Eremiobacteraeota bacterium]|nr:hypothetical protein [Candidatus Eremiobacteraeota bacterium]
MRLLNAKNIISAVGVALLAACGGGSAAMNGAPLPLHPPGNITHDAILSNIVGVGDSLTAGYQADGFLGQTHVRNPYNTFMALPPTQENGWWALLAEQASGEPLDSAV